MEVQRKFFTSLLEILFCIDHSQERVPTIHQRGGRSSYELEGPHEIAHRIRLYTNTTHDGLHIDLGYTMDQNYPSMVLMPALEECIGMPNVHIFLHHPEFQTPPVPCINGNHVRSYIGLRDNSSGLAMSSESFRHCNWEAIRHSAIHLPSVDQG